MEFAKTSSTLRADGVFRIVDVSPENPRDSSADEDGGIGSWCRNLRGVGWGSCAVEQPAQMAVDYSEIQWDLK
jgi:hypothetical protein